ncbi:MAG: 50S ribosomal protein L29 [Actinomycetota bacterium]|nr:50S ribosomal protein L29 [Actinomycetota bacterium]
MKVKDLINISDQELEEKLKETKTELFNLRFQLATGQLENHMRIKEVKKNIARLQTIHRERELKKEALG